MIKAAGKGDICDAPVSGVQKTAAYFQPVCVQKINGGLLQVAPEDPAAFAPADISGGGDLIQCDLFSVMLIEEGDHVLLDLQILIHLLSVRTGDQFLVFLQSVPEGLHESDDFYFVSFFSLFLQSGDP